MGSAVSTYAAWQPTLQPTALRGPWGERWAAGLGAEKDAALALAKEATKSRFLTLTPSDALSLIGADRDIERATIDTAATYRARLTAAWDVWSWAGTHYGYANALALTSALIAGARFVPQYQWSSPPDGRTGLWSRFWVVVWTGALAVGRFTVGPWATVGADASPFDVLLVGSFTVGDGSTVGSDMTRAQLGEIRNTLAKWKNTRDRVPALILADGGDIVGMPGLLVGGFAVGGSAITYTLDLVVGDFVVGATPRTPDVPWFPIIGHSNLV